MFKSLKEAQTPAEMRAALEEAANHHPIVRSALMMARRDGMPAEDVYSVLAYFAMQSLVQTQRDYLDLLNRLPPPAMIITADSPLLGLLSEKHPPT